MNTKHKKIALVGGGTGGPTIPLLAVAEKMRAQYPEIEFVFIGTSNGPEKNLAEEANMEFISVIAGKWRRYFSLQNFLDLILLPLAVIQSAYVLIKHKVEIVFSVGGYVAVPVIWAGAFLRKKIVIHQQDIEIGLANKLTLPFAHVVTATFESHKNIAREVQIVGNPVRSQILTGSKERAMSKWNLSGDKPTILVFGGGTGSKFLYELVEKSAVNLIDNGIQVIHLTGNVPAEPSQFLEKIAHGYVAEKFFNDIDMADAYAAADLVVCRAGLSTIAELSNLSKASVIIPMPNSHQEVNARFLKKEKAAIVCEQNELNEISFAEKIIDTLENKKYKEELQKNISMIMPRDSAARICKIVYNLAKKN